MKISVRDLLEGVALLLVVVVVALATGLLWAALLALAVVLAYLSHAWTWDDIEVTIPRVWERKTPEPRRPAPIVTNRRAM